MNNGEQITIKFFATAFAYTGIRLVLAMEYHLQSGGRVKQFSSALFAKLYHFIHEYQQNWDVYLRPLANK